MVKSLSSSENHLLIMKYQPTEAPARDEVLLAQTTDCNDWYLTLDRRCYLSKGMKERFAVRKIAIHFVGNDWKPVPFGQTKDLAKVILTVYRSRGVAGIINHNASNNLGGCGIFKGQGRRRQDVLTLDAIDDLFDVLQIAFPIPVRVEIIICDTCSMTLGDDLVDRKARSWH